MIGNIKIHTSADTWTVRAGGAVLGESSNALELVEGDNAPVVYFPREDIAMAFLDPSDKTSHCPIKGDARYFSVVTKSRTLDNVVWSFEAPNDAAAQLKDHLAFHSVEEVTIEKI
ncbi:DUF427 domain-containing protein [uncultured Sulfitobacter sp.]|uniref:DUF427 domain-containing protein n=1 Tax=uncultured Sulfitobacter sp. TaxID=191468 RepID=UPI00262EF24C|nr:DUF427 domain-containing protein [uncultured Sulfitobacter sp.]